MIKVYQDTRAVFLQRDNNNIYISTFGGYIAKLNVNDFSVLSAVNVSGLYPERLSLQALPNTKSQYPL